MHNFYWPDQIQARDMLTLQVDDTTLEITELPVRKWTQDYKEFLEGLIKPEEKAGPAVLADYREHHSDADVHFTLQLLPGQMDACLAAGLHAKFKLTNKMSCGARAPPEQRSCVQSLKPLPLLIPSTLHSAEYHAFAVCTTFEFRCGGRNRRDSALQARLRCPLV